MAVSTDPFSYDGYSAVLETYVDDDGMVDYGVLKANSDGLDTFAAALGSLNPISRNTTPASARCSIFLQQFLNEDEWAFLDTGQYEIESLDCDWSFERAKKQQALE